jgi:hypothetical protein
MRLFPAYTGATAADTQSGDTLITLKKSTNCFKRYKSIGMSQQLLLTKVGGVIPLSQLPNDSQSEAIQVESTSECGTKRVTVKKGGEGDKELWIEIWDAKQHAGLTQAVKISDVCAKVYNDVVFGGISWSKDMSQVVFIGEIPPPKTYKNPWDLPQEEAKDKEEESKDTEEHWLETKFEHQEEFGELLVGKKSAGIFVYNLKENKVKRMYGIPKDVWPQYPCFDEHSQGLVFSGVNQPFKRLGLIYCLNR